MATTNLFSLLGTDADDVEDTSLLIQAHDKKDPPPANKDAAPSPKLPSKPLPPSQAVREARNETGRGAGRGGRGYGRGRGPSGSNRDLSGGNNDGSFANDSGNSMGYNVDKERPTERRGGFGGPRGGFRGGRRGGFSNGDAFEGERPRRAYERRSGSGRGGDIKRDGAGRGNWGTPADEIAPETEEAVAENNASVVTEKQSGEEAVDAEKENPVKEPEEKEPEEKQMTLEEYEKVLEEKRKSLLQLKVEERKVDVDKEFESMQLVSKKKIDDEVFIKLGSDKDKRKEERAKKSVNILEFLKATEGDAYYRPGGRGRGRGGRGRGGGGGGEDYNVKDNVKSDVKPAPSIEDATQFPSLGAK